MRIDRQDRGGERGGGNGNQRRLVFNPRKEGSEENFPLSSPETSLTRQTSSLLRRCVLFFFCFFSFISKLSKLQMLGMKEKSESSIPLEFLDKISCLCISVTSLRRSLFSLGQQCWL